MDRKITMTNSNMEGVRFINKDLDVERHGDQYWAETDKMRYLIDGNHAIFRCRKSSVITYTKQ